MDFLIKVDNFEGPMDLLIELIKKREMDVYNLQISQITKDYMDNLSILVEKNIELTAEFMSLASKLLQIKAKMLIPITTESEDPRNELVNQILDFQIQKEAAERLLLMKHLENRLFKRQKEEKIKKQKKGTWQDIIKSYQSILAIKHGSKENKFAEMTNETDRYQFTIEDRMAFLQNCLEKERMDITAYFLSLADKEQLVETFAALLELVKAQEVSIYSEQEILYIDKKGGQTFG